MSTTVFPEAEKFPESVLVRAFNDQPLSRKALGRLNELAIEVCGTDEMMSMGFRNEDVYRFDEKLFKALSVAYKANNRKQLARLWAKAEPFKRRVPK